MLRSWNRREASKTGNRMDETQTAVRPVVYETRHHATRPYIPNYPPQIDQQAHEASKRGVLSYLPVRGVSRLKEKWSEYWRSSREIRRHVSLFISPRGERVAVAAGNQITILQQDDDYKEPCGIFTSRTPGAFICGVWSETHDILGAADGSGTVYFIKSNGEEITRITNKHLKGSLPIITLIAEDATDRQTSCLCTFTVLTADGCLHSIEISQEPSASISSACASSSGLTSRRQFPLHVFCVDYCPELSLLVVVSSAIITSLTSSGNTGSCISIWRRCKNLDLEQPCFTQFEGLYCKPKGYKGNLALAKVLISPQGKFIATSDITGCLHIFKINYDNFSLSKAFCGERFDSQVTDNSLNGGNFFRDVVDFTWWSDHVLTLARKDGFVTMIDILSGLKVQDSDSVHAVLVLDRVEQLKGHVFLLESKSLEERFNTSNYNGGTIDSNHIEEVDISMLHWSLISLSERSVPDMYNILISNHKYKRAMDFANIHGLDTDEVFKSQWLYSRQGIDEINMFLSKIKDQAFVISECVDKIGPTEDAVKALLAHGLRLTSQYKFSEEDNEGSQIWDFRVSRLQLLQFGDRLETYLGINMGRYHAVLSSIDLSWSSSPLPLF